MNERIYWTDDEILLIQANLPLTGSDLKRVNKAQTVLPLNRRRKLTEEAARKVIDKKVLPKPTPVAITQKEIIEVLVVFLIALAEYCEKKSKE